VAQHADLPPLLLLEEEEEEVEEGESCSAHVLALAHPNAHENGNFVAFGSSTLTYMYISSKLFVGPRHCSGTY
jgi:hypothetical protein